MWRCFAAGLRAGLACFSLRKGSDDIRRVVSSKGYRSAPEIPDLNSDGPITVANVT
jgi:hypothetical protein